MSLTNPPVVITCDQGHEFTKLLGELEANPSCMCPTCGQAILVDTKHVAAQLAELSKTITNFNRR